MEEIGNIKLVMTIYKWIPPSLLALVAFTYVVLLVLEMVYIRSNMGLFTINYLKAMTDVRLGRTNLVGLYFCTFTALALSMSYVLIAVYDPPPIIRVATIRISLLGFLVSLCIRKWEVVSQYKKQGKIDE